MAGRGNSLLMTIGLGADLVVVGKELRLALVKDRLICHILVTRGPSYRMEDKSAHQQAAYRLTANDDGKMIAMLMLPYGCHFANEI